MSHNDIFSQQCSLIARFVTLLGAFRVKGMSEREVVTSDGCISSLFSQTKEANCLVPCLSLSSSKHNSSIHDEDDRHHIEEHAASNLARPILASRVESSTNFTFDNTIFGDRDFGLVPFHQLPSTILNNLSDSFLTLIDARLRAYITILARHGMSLSECPISLAQKLSALIDIGNGVKIENLVTFFNFDENFNHKLENKEKTEMPLRMEITMDVSIPNFTGGMELLTIETKTDGLIKASFDNDAKLLHQVDVEVDTHELLTDLVERASLIISKALESVRIATTIKPIGSQEHHTKDESTTLRSIVKAEKITGANSPSALVSPDIAPKHGEIGIEPLQLNKGSSIDKLSPQKCANIVDFVIGEVTFPKFKKRRITTPSTD